jgi:hypothetical protein
MIFIEVQIYENKFKKGIGDYLIKKPQRKPRLKPILVWI